MPPSPTVWKAFERAAARDLSLWITDGGCDKVLARQSLMGRMAEEEWGDFAPHPDVPVCHRARAIFFLKTFFADAKKRRGFSLDGLLVSANHPFWAWWGKARGDAQRHKKTPLLILAAPFRAAWVALPCVHHRVLLVRSTPRIFAHAGGVLFYPFEEFCRSFQLGEECPDHA